MRKLILPASLLISFCAHTQIVPGIDSSDVTRIENTLAADDMQGRQVFTSGIEKAAGFIRDEFKKAGLKPLPGSKDYTQSFAMADPASSEATGLLDGISIGKKNMVVFSADSSLVITPADHYQKIFLKKANDFMHVLFKYLDADQNVLIFVDTSMADKFKRLSNIHMPQFKGNGNRIFILYSADPQRYRIEIKQKIKTQSLSNIVGIIPGKTKPDEYVIFSAHYDHLGIGKPDASGDSVYNGANDDASGTTAVITLAKYFSKLNNNQRTIIFVAFTAEEVGEFGSAYFSKHMDADKVMAMFNIEMIGTESKWGKNSAYMTGFDKSDMGTILQRNLVNTQFKFYPDPYPEQMLFLRSDNATLAQKGVPAHSISTSKMDSEPYYHQPGDEVKTLDLANMTQIIQSIAISAGSIVAGNDTPLRVKKE
jgi:Zn-dependent M28 family amino/carboxypeptidase